jgi:hypothetical protein
MAAPLRACTKEQHSIIHFLITVDVKPIEVHQQMKIQYGNACLSHWHVYEWNRKFRNGVMSGRRSSPRSGTQSCDPLA